MASIESNQPKERLSYQDYPVLHKLSLPEIQPIEGLKLSGLVEQIAWNVDRNGQDILLLMGNPGNGKTQILRDLQAILSPTNTVQTHLYDHHRPLTILGESTTALQRTNAGTNFFTAISTTIRDTESKHHKKNPGPSIHLIENVGGLVNRGNDVLQRLVHTYPNRVQILYLLDNPELQYQSQQYRGRVLELLANSHNVSDIVTALNSEFSIQLSKDLDFRTLQEVFISCASPEEIDECFEETQTNALAYLTGKKLRIHSSHKPYKKQKYVPSEIEISRNMTDRRRIISLANHYLEQLTIPHDYIETAKNQLVITLASLHALSCDQHVTFMFNNVIRDDQIQYNIHLDRSS